MHLNNPRDVVPESNMPAYPWLEQAPGRRRQHRATHMRRCAASACPTPTPRSRRPQESVKGKTEMDALVAYLQVLGHLRSSTRRSPSMDIDDLRIATSTDPGSFVAFMGIAWLGLLAAQHASASSEAAHASLQQDCKRGQRHERLHQTASGPTIVAR